MSEKFDRQLKLMALLIGNNHLTLNDIAKKLEMSTRSLYRYIEFFEQAGFDVFNDHGIYCIDYSSPFVASITQKMHFNYEELQMILQQLKTSGRNNPIANRIRQKIRSTYGMEMQEPDPNCDKHITDNIDTIKRAIKERHQCIFKQYESLHGKSLKDRLVEPYQMVNIFDEVRCYEVESGQCKTFKIARIKGNVVLCDKRWNHREQHLNYFTDIFGFTAEKTNRATLRVTKVAKRILMEEYGVDEQKILLEDGIHYLVSIPYCDARGIGRFVMGLLNEVEIVKGRTLQDYIQQELEIYQHK